MQEANNVKHIELKNFKLNVFRNLMEQSLIVNQQLIFEFQKQFVRSCSFSSTKSFVKLWTSNIENLIAVENELDTVNIDDFEPFDVYILKGDMFKKFLTVHTSDTVDLEFTVINRQATTLKVTGKSENGNNLVTHFILTTEELINDKVSDYNSLIKEFTPDATMGEFTLSANQIQEIKRLVKKLHKSTADNAAYLTFNVDTENRKIIVNDKVFNVEFEIDENSKIFNTKQNFKFNILKSDFVIAGNQTFTIWTEENTQKIIFGAQHAGSIIWCLVSKIQEQSELNLDSSIVDSTIDALGDDFGDDLPF